MTQINNTFLVRSDVTVSVTSRVTSRVAALPHCRVHTFCSLIVSLYRAWKPHNFCLVFKSLYLDVGTIK